jgi:hypothetical protein
MAEFKINVYLKIDFHLVPVAFIISYLFAVGANGQDTPEHYHQQSVRSVSLPDPP